MKAVFIVEGVNDADQINKAFNYNDDIIILITEGTKVDPEMRAKMEDYLNRGYGVYILSDPDEAGDTLAAMIQSWYPKIGRIEVELKECAYYTGKKHKAGIEYASYKYLRKIISPYIGMEYVEEEPCICWD